MMQSLMACINNTVSYHPIPLLWRIHHLALHVGWTIKLQEWVETNGGSSLLDSLYKALDEVSLIYRILCNSYKEAVL